MNKIMGTKLFLVAVIIAGVMVLSRMYFANPSTVEISGENENAIQSAGKDDELAKSKVQNSMSIASNSLATSESSGSSRAENLKQSIERAKHSIATLSQYERELRNLKADEIETELRKSQLLLASKGLIEKSNQGLLSDAEVQLLVSELRKQSVLNHLQTKHKVEAAKRKYL